MLLKDKKILVGVTGSIAVYKSLELIRLYIKAGAKVRVIMTEGAKKFIAPLTFEAISQSKILDESLIFVISYLERCEVRSCSLRVPVIRVKLQLNYMVYEMVVFQGD